MVSDAIAVGNLVTQGFARDGEDAAARALAAGLDMDMASGVFGQNLVALVKDGTLQEAQIDEAVRRVLAVKVRLGLFEQPYADEARAAAVGRGPAAPPGGPPRRPALDGAAAQREEAAAARRSRSRTSP